jgi:hypothetical protein
MKDIFRGAGAVESKWRLELPSKLRCFDYGTISDVNLHISYTAKDEREFRTIVEIIQLEHYLHSPPQKEGAYIGC